MAAFENRVDVDVDVGKGTDYCVYNIPVFPCNISLDPAGTKMKGFVA